MASTITAQTLKVKITETISLGGVDRGSTTTASIASIGEIMNGIVRVDTAGTMLLEFGNDAARAGSMAAPNTTVKYIRLTNLDDTNYILVKFQNGSTDCYFEKLHAGKSIIMGSLDIDASATNLSFGAHSVDDIDTIEGEADTADCDLEYYIAAT